MQLRNVSGEEEEKMAIPENIGQGAAALDYDRDGLLDLFVANGDRFPGTPGPPSPGPRLFHNESGLRFRDVTEEAGLALRGVWMHGAWAVDFDADGWQDLYITVFRGPNLFFRNLGDGTFKDVSDTWGGADTGPSTCAAFFDADGDGDLDLYVGNYVDYDPENPPNNGRPCQWKGLLVSCGPRGTTPGPDTFYENREGRLVEATESFGFGDVKPVYALGAIAADLEPDGDTDLYVANDSTGNFLWINDGDGGFRESAFDYGLQMSRNGTPQAGMGVDFGDVDNDGLLDLFVTNFSHDYNTLYVHTKTADGRSFFQDETSRARIQAPTMEYLSWGTRILDLDHDGWCDLVVVSGHVYPQVDGSGLDTSYAQDNQLFRNRGRTRKGGVTFENVSGKLGAGFRNKAVSRGLVTADFDNDGDLDLFIVEMDAQPTLLRHDGRGLGHWAGFLLVGAGGNREAVGARLEVTASDGTTRHLSRSYGGSYLSTCDPRLHVGLGTAGGPLRQVVVRWPSGTVTKLEDLEPGRYWVIEEASGKAVPAR